MSGQPPQPRFDIVWNDARVTLLGTAHVSDASVKAVEELLRAAGYGAVAVELCPSRRDALLDPRALEGMDLLKALREGKAAMVMANLALGAYQQRIAAGLGVEPGAEMRAALLLAEERRLPVWLIDREIGTTLKRLYRDLGWRRRFSLFASFLASFFTAESISAEELEKLKGRDVLEATLAQCSEEFGEIFTPLINERDRYMCARLRQELAVWNGGAVLVVVGAGHLAGMQAELQNQLQPDAKENAATLAELERIPPAGRWSKAFAWVIVSLVAAGFALGFTRGPDLGWQLIGDWIIINGGLSAAGAIAAAAHPLTVLSAFVAAPLTSLNPAIGAGMVTAAVEIWLRKPGVGDFSRLKSDVAHLSGWWKNRVARILLVFLFSTLGSAVGTYVAGFRIFERLL